MNSSFVHVFEPATSASAPPLVLLHGTGGDELDLLQLGRRLSPGSALLSPRGKVSEHGANRFFARLGEGVFDPAEVTRRTHELADFIAEASREYQLNPANLIAVGLSNGANVAATILQLRTGILGGAILFRPMVVLEKNPEPKTLVGTRVLIASGTQDPIVPNTEPPRLAEMLRAGGAKVTLTTTPAGHGLTSADLTAAVSFLAK